jgi:hypothetical protein
LLEIYRQLDHHQSALLLQRLLALPAERNQDLIDLHALARDWAPHGDDENVLHTWLLTALDARFPPAAPPEQPAT